MSLRAITNQILRAGTALQVAAYEYLDSDHGSEKEIAALETCSKEIVALIRKLKKEDSE